MPIGKSREKDEFSKAWEETFIGGFSFLSSFGLGVEETVFWKSSVFTSSVLQIARISPRSSLAPCVYRSQNYLKFGAAVGNSRCSTVRRSLGLALSIHCEVPPGTS